MSSLPSYVVSRVLPHVLAIAVAAAGCVGVAFWARAVIEREALTDIGLVLSASGNDWAEVSVDGLSVRLSGVAPDEATRFAALSEAGSVVDASRLIDDMDVAAVAAIAPPEFSIELLKNEDGISLIGLVPLESSPETIVERVRAVSDNAEISDLLESADFAPPPGWEQALSFGIEAIDELPRSKVSITPSQVAITAVAKSPEDRAKLERRLNRDAPAGLRLSLNISAPRPVVAPFTLRFLIDEAGARFDACTADSDEARDAILLAAKEAGLTRETDCVLGLGTPSTRWGEAAVAGIAAVHAFGAGTLTISNADVSLVAPQGTARGDFDRVAGELEAALPPVFSLSAVLPKPPAEEVVGEAAPAEFTATLSPEGQVQLRGRLGDEATRAAVQSFAAAKFGVEKVYPATRLDPAVPPGWPKRVLAALEALHYLNNGAARVTEDEIRISGVTGRQDAQSAMARVLSDKLEDGASFSLDVTYSEALDPLAALPTPEECIALINEAGNKRKITFAPSSTEFERDAVQTIDAIAEILRDCQSVQIEIGGHTDSQGREIMNEQLSQARADAVLNAIMARRVLTSNLTARGYGESKPIASNETEEGREANRRIEFRLAADAAADAAQEAGSPGDEAAGDEETPADDAAAEGEATEGEAGGGTDAEATE